jgi:hypothetical protein
MKKIFTLLFLLSGTLVASAQLLVEDFNYSGALNANGWITHSGAGTNPISTTTGLTFSGYGGSGVGNAALMGNAGGEDVNKGLGWDNNTNNTAIYVSFLINVTDAAATKSGDYLLHLGDRPTDPSTWSGNFATRFYVRITASGVNFGTSHSTTVSYGATNFAKNTTYLVVLKTQVATAGNDPITMWVYPSGSTIPSDEASAGTPEVSVTNQTGTSNDVYDGIALRQGGNTSSVQAVIDGIRVANHWYNAPLPVSVLSFNAALNNKVVNLDWSTANEVNAASFELERSVNGKDFVRISSVSAKNAMLNNYNFVDERLAAGTNYYRLKIVDKDGSYKYSTIVSVKAKSEGVGVFPNPVKGNFTVQHEAAIKGATISVIDFAGKQVATVNVQAGAIQTNLDASRFTPGTYMIVYNNDGVKLTKQFVKQ